MYSCYIGVRIPKISVLKADFKLFVPLYFISIVNMKMAENLAVSWELFGLGGGVHNRSHRVTKSICSSNPR